MDRGGSNHGVVYGIFGHECRFCCSAFDILDSELWCVCWDRGSRGAVVSILSEGKGFVEWEGRTLAWGVVLVWV